MADLMVIGNCYSDTKENAAEIFNVLSEAGYILAYQNPNKTSAIIMKEENNGTTDE